MKSTKRNLFLIILPIIVLVSLFVILAYFFNEKEKEPVLNGGFRAPYIEYNGSQYLFEAPTEDGNMFFEIQENWAELDTDTVKFMYFDNEKYLEKDIIYYDTTLPSKGDLYLRVNEQWLKRKCNTSDHSEAFVRLHIRPAEEKEPVLIGSTQATYIEYNGFKYYFEDPLKDGNMFFEVQEGWAELDPETVKYMYFDGNPYLEKDIIYYDTTKPSKGDLYLRVNEQWLKWNCNISNHSEGFVRLHIHSGVG